MGIREQKQQDTRRRMVEAARRLFTEQGYDETTVDMIAEAAGVSTRTFHRYFETKDGVVIEAGHRIVDRAISLLPPAATVADIVRSLAAATETDLDVGDVEWSVRLRRENPALQASMPVWRHRWTERVAHALAARDDRSQPTLAQRVRSAAAVHASSVAADEWVLCQPRRPLSELAEEAIGVLAQDLARVGGTSPAT